MMRPLLLAAILLCLLAAPWLLFNSSHTGLLLKKILSTSCDFSQQLSWCDLCIAAIDRGIERDWVRASMVRWSPQFPSGYRLMSSQCYYIPFQCSISFQVYPNIELMVHSTWNGNLELIQAHEFNSFFKLWGLGTIAYRSKRWEVQSYVW